VYSQSVIFNVTDSLELFEEFFLYKDLFWWSLLLQVFKGCGLLGCKKWASETTSTVTNSTCRDYHSTSRVVLRSVIYTATNSITPLFLSASFPRPSNVIPARITLLKLMADGDAEKNRLITRQRVKVQRAKLTMRNDEKRYRRKHFACVSQCCIRNTEYKYLLTLSYDRTIFYDEWNDTFDNVRAYCLFITWIYPTTLYRMSKRHVLILSFTCSISIYECSTLSAFISKWIYWTDNSKDSDSSSNRKHRLRYFTIFLDLWHLSVSCAQR